MPRATVPEASIHENGKMRVGENKVGVAEKGDISAPAGNGVFPHHLDQSKLGGAVSSSPYA